jgi:DMSO/TMAO reductase YedYZ molybdopterin-dependent catalytic subunit
MIRTILSFAVFILFLTGCIYAWNWLHTQPKEQAALKPLRKGMDLNESVFSSFFNPDMLTKEFSKEDAVKKVRVNGFEGLRSVVDSNWMLNIIRNTGDTLKIGMAEIKTLPKTEIVFEFKCIEGWSQISHWGGVRFSDLIKRYNLENEVGLDYTGLLTPDKKYYVGIDQKSMMHPQTLLCYEMNGKTLPVENGYPLRLIIPVKYGVKHLKRIGTIYFSNERPADFWYERGYDYYCGL